MKLLTVAVPCYNSAAYMRNCIESLLPGGDRVEIIIVDDGSTDDTGKIADEYATKYSTMVKVIHQENGGHGEGINRSVEAGTGIYYKVVDSDDTLSGDFVKFLDTLEECEGKGGVDLVVTNYYYVHSDGKGDRSIWYGDVLPKNRIFGWEDTKKFKIHQMLTIHSCTFRLEMMKNWKEELPKHVFYEDNLMVYQSLLEVKRLYYFDADLYRYFIGRADQSVQQSVMTKRCSHQILVTERCYTAIKLDTVNSPMLRNYLEHELYMMLGISILFTRLNDTDEADKAIDDMWAKCFEADGKLANRFRYHTIIRFLCIKGKPGRFIIKKFYRLANRVVRFN